MSTESVIRELREKNTDIEVLEMPQSIATVEEAAAALHIEPDAVAKTLALHAGDRVVIIVISGATRIDNKKFREAFGCKARMLLPDEVEPLTGQPVGGVSPFGLNVGLPVYLDESLRRHAVVYPAAGSRVHALRIEPERLAELTGGRWINIGRDASETPPGAFEKAAAGHENC